MCLARPAGAGESVVLETRIRESLALELDDGSAQKFELEVQPTLRAALPQSVQLTAIVRARVESLDHIEPGRPGQATYFAPTARFLVGDVGELEMRELYVERDFDRAHVTIGKQQVVWGKADGIKVLDVVNPQSFREFILPPFEESRIPLWTAAAEVPTGPLSTQLLWIPDSTVHDLPRDGAPYEITSRSLAPQEPPGMPIVLRSSRRPKDVFGDSDAGLRLSGNARGWDFTINYLYHYDDAPVPFRELILDPDGFTAVVTPRYRRTHVVGGTFANTFGDFTFRGETAVFTDRFVATNDLFDGDGVLHEEEYSYLFGLDWFGAGPGTFVSAQISQSIVPGLPSQATREDLQSIATFLFRREFADGAGLIQTMLLMDPARGDGLARGRIQYEVLDWLRLAVGIDGFFGNRGGIFGQYDHRDRIVFEVEQSL